MTSSFSAGAVSVSNKPPQSPLSSSSSSSRILIIDFGAQYTQLIARSIRELGVYCEIYPYSVDGEKIRRFAPSGVILSGGPASVTSTECTQGPIAPIEIFSLEVPVLGICYGMQTLVDQLGGSVEKAKKREYGQTQVRTCSESPLLGSGATLLDVWMSHSDRVTALPDGFEVIAKSGNSPYAAIMDEHRRYYGVQFHVEVTHTAKGRDILSRFVHHICHCGHDWMPQNIITNMLTDIRAKVATNSVILGLSGGVDSSVMAVLLHQAIGRQLTCIFVDTGLLRLHEGDEIMQTFAENFDVRVIRVDAESEFLNALKGVADPEQKRKIIGKLFINIFEREAEKIKHVKWLAQGTIYPDVIESAGGDYAQAKVIKSHHNVGGLPANMKLKLLEPLKFLFKDEVKKIGKALNLSEKIINRHPFPGPGFGVRILGEIRKEFIDILRQADVIYLEELERHGLYHEISQAFAVFLPVKSVGVVGDNRAYEYVIALRAVETVDFMTADWKRMPYDVLAIISNRILNEVHGISRVVYDVSGKPPATIEWE